MDGVRLPSQGVCRVSDRNAARMAPRSTATLLRSLTGARVAPAASLGDMGSSGAFFHAVVSGVRHRNRIRKTHLGS